METGNTVKSKIEVQTNRVAKQLYRIPYVRTGLNAAGNSVITGTETVNSTTDASSSTTGGVIIIGFTCVTSISGIWYLLSLEELVLLTVRNCMLELYYIYLQVEVHQAH